ncbi:MAG: thiol:disulfide interchange protein DsbD [Candidatus Paceibacteria bacterium]|jgi:thiol:disulfide interchange protein DsbD|tara:strand:- start:2054 stop:3892 length:1839 start_codon:yes stop_codon:yes gene_type:complete
MAILGIKSRSLVIGLILAVFMCLLLPVQAQAALFSTTKHPLPADQAFAISAQQYNDKIEVMWTIADDYYLYQDKLVFTTSNNQPLEQVLLPPAVIKQDPVFGTTKVYYRQLRVTGALPSSNTAATHLTIHYQGCWTGGVCYPPQITTIALTAINTVTADSQSLSLGATDWSKTSSTNANWFIQNLENTSIATLLVIFLLAGLALAFTPCVLPMVPILSSIIVGLNPKPGPTKSFLLSFIYVLSMAATYSVAGLVAGLSGANVQIALQHPAVIGTTATLFVLFSVAMFGWINVQIPQAIQNKINAISNNQLGGQYTGVAVMGILSALVVGPCVAAPLAGALLFIAQTGDAATGGLALFAMGFGMGLPLLLVGTSASKWIPKTGPWMHRIKVGFGFLMLLMALWMTDRVWPELTLLLVALIAIVMALVLALHHRWKPPLETMAGAVISYTLAMFLGLYGTVLAVGQLAGTGTLLQPLGSLVANESKDMSQAVPRSLNFSKVLPQEVAALLRQAKLDKQPVMLDFYADWCISCKELDSFVFTDSRVQLALSDFKVIKVDVTVNSPAAQQLMQSMNLVGPPALVFYNAKGQVNAETVIGVPAIDDLVKLVHQVNTL